jgi:hypothetical protein
MGSRYEQAALGGAFWRLALQLFGQSSKVTVAQGLLETFDHSTGFGGRLMGEFQAEMCNPRFAPIFHVGDGYLSLRAKNGVAATDIG